MCARPGGVLPRGQTQIQMTWAQAVQTKEEIHARDYKTNRPMRYHQPVVTNLFAIDCCTPAYFSFKLINVN